ncbi:uncharacterized protein LOC132169107 [Corylus avellana]|uniref:uncharacterized protein LOC132169107 n=1 Tax=Corylus avellana TaxID=13451 RepID=UPI00286C08F5|nr:uncharacterized protein LOC132169107 [Corylus avellana]
MTNALRSAISLKRNVSRTFGEGKCSFEEYIFALKDTVGINMLIEAIGIGKGKQDLTGLAMEPIKTNHVISLHPEIPIGKACSSFTAADIIKSLRGNVRLSKARSSDLFWEAVWPRLLARGWHSEQPNDHGVSGSKHSLVFLIPGVKKFSRRKLVKGNHYFDSVSDVLNKVASDPGLLELQIDAGEGSGHKEDKWEPLRKQNVDGLSNKQHHCYLQPRTSNCNRDIMKFTVVDTSAVHETELPKVRELRSLPFHTTSLSTSSSLSSETEQDTSEESEDEAEEINTSNPAGDMTEMEASVDSSDCVGVLNSMDPIIAAVEDHNSPNTSLLKENGQGKAMKHHFSKKMNSSHSKAKYLAPVMKQQALNAFNCGESSHSIGDISADRKQNDDESHCQSTLPSACHDMAFRVCPRNLSSDSSLAKSSQEGSNAASVTENCLGGEVSPGNHQPQIFIDLNLPHDSQDIGTEEPFIMDMMPTNGSSCANKLSSLSETSQQPEPSKISDSGASTEQQPTTNSRRQSMRSRPLTTKVWEALESGLFDTKRKRKRVDTSHNSISRSSQKIRGNAALSSTLNNGAGNDIVDSTMEVNLDEVCSSKVNVAGEPPV